MRLRLRQRLRDLKYWVLYRTTRRHAYHVVRTDLKPGYYDTDIRMLHAMMTLMVQFVEEELEGREDLVEKLELYRADGHSKWEVAYQTLLEIYDWWKDPIRRRHRRKSTIVDEEFMRQWENEMLIKLIEIRGYLWT